MSMHKSLSAKGRLKRHRNVLTRTERISKLEQEERWKQEANSVFSLPKVRVIRLKKGAKKKEEKAEEGAAAAPAAGAKAPAAGAKAPAAAKAAPAAKGKK
jgi:small basic protein (TIGR04137 family)